MKKHFAKRALALALSAVLLVSCWVFTAPTASAATSVTLNNQSITTGTSQPTLTNGKGQYRVRILIVEDGEHNKFLDGSNMDGTIHDNKAYKAGIKYVNSTVQSDSVAGRSITGKTDTGDYWCEWAQITYKNSNGTGNEGAVWFNLGDKDAGGRSDVISSGGQLCGYFPADDGLLINGFPTGVTCKYFEDSGFSNSSFYFYLQVATWNGSSWSWTGDVGGNGTQGTGGSSCDATHRKGIASNYSGNSRPSECWATSNGSTRVPVRSTGSILNSAYPKPTSDYTGSSFAPAYSNTSAVSIPKTSSASAVTRTLSYTEPVDQYGITMVHTISVASNVSSTAGTGGLSQSSKTTSIGFNQNATGTTNSQTITATLKWPYINASGTSTNLQKTTTLTANDAKYTVTFKDENNNIIKVNNADTQSIYYGSAATAPADPTKAYDADYHYNWDGWDKTFNNITADTTVTSNGFTPVAHTIGYTPLADGDVDVDVKHNATCNICGYATTENHSYGETSFSFADDGKSANVSRQCTVNGCNHIQTGNVSLSGGGITKQQQAAPTCTAMGTTRYTATSPFSGDSSTDYQDVVDIAATGHHLADDPIMYSDAEGHYYKCKDCEVFIKSDLSEGKHAHTPKAAQQENVVPATCTQAGSYNSVVRCSEEACNWAISSTPHTIPALDHDWGDWDTTDAANHTRVCSRDSSHVDTGAHAFSNWSKNIPQDDTLIEKMKPDYDPSAQCFRYCNVCYRIEYSNHNYVGTETAAATCEGTGVKTYTCSICNDSYTETIPAKGHDYEEKTNQPVDAHIGFEYFECSACHKLRQAAYNGSTYVPDETKPEYAPDALSSLEEAVQSDPTNTSIVPASTFNNFVDQTIPIGGGNYYNYSERGSGLRLMRNEETGAVDYSFNPDLTTIQDMRFSGAATLPTGVSISVNPAYRDYSEEDLKDAHVDNCLVDFGYIYTQDDYMIKEGGFEALTIENTDKTEHPDTKFARMSVASNNKDNGTYNPTEHNWTGVTYHSGVRQLTFNLVIRIKAKNWSFFYSCRPYMRYMYHGHLYTVYDEVAFGPTYSCNMVYYVADDMVRAHDPLTEYATRKIIDNYDYLPKGDLK